MLKQAGLFSVCVSLDHWREEIHDRGRNDPGAFRAALQAIRIFKDAGLHTGASAVLSEEMIASGDCREFLAFLEGPGVHEARLSDSSRPCRCRRRATTWCSCAAGARAEPRRSAPATRWRWTRGCARSAST